MGTVTSRDGTQIAFDQSGDGPPLVIVGAALSDRSDTRKLADLLSDRFTVFNYDRRGRGESGDTQPYAVEREFEDLAAVIEAAGGSADVFGSSSGAVLALRAAAAGVNVRKLVVFEPPFRVDDSTSPLPADYEARLAEFLASDRRGDAVKLFMSKAVGVPGPLLLVMRLIPGMWRKMTAVAHTLPYDHAVVGDTLAGRPLSPSEWATVLAPTLVIDGEKSPPVFRNAVEALVGVLPDATRLTLVKQHHGAVEMAPKVVAAAVGDYLAA